MVLTVKFQMNKNYSSMYMLNLLVISVIGIACGCVLLPGTDDLYALVCAKKKISF